MAKAVVMQVTDIKNRQQDMNTRQFLSTAADSIRPLRRKIRTLPKIWLAVCLSASLAALALPALAAPDYAAPDAGAVGGAAATVATSTAEHSHVQQTQTQQAQVQQATDESPATAGMDNQGRADWRELEQGLSFGEFQLNDGDARLSVLRIDPAHFDFTLCARSQDSGPSRSLNEWGEQYNLSAAINASMYLPDGSTSTGYMRQGDHTNNGRIVQRFGAFFVAGPDEPGLPLAAIIDRDNPLWRQQMERYSLVIQNYRMINADRRILWSPGGPHYSISAVAQDGEGQILFMHCRQPVEAYAFAQQVLHLPLNVRTVMYVEGGGQAGLLVRSAALRRELIGLSPSGLLVTGDLRAVLPNVLGARRKGTPTHADDSSPQASAHAAESAPAPAANKGEDAAQAQGLAQPGPEQPAQPQQARQTAPAGPAGPIGPAPLLAPSHTVQPDPRQPADKQNASETAASPASPTSASPSANTAPNAATESLTEPGTSLAHPPAGSASPSTATPDKQSKK
jgi:hypothetical protein